MTYRTPRLVERGVLTIHAQAGVMELRDGRGEVVRTIIYRPGSAEDTERAEQWLRREALALQARRAGHG
jgi:hypothetical protein